MKWRGASILFCVALALSCRTKPPQDPPEWAEARPLEVRKSAPPLNPSVLLYSGALPIAYIVDNGGAIRIIDADSKQVLVSMSVPPRSPIVIDAQRGILISGRVVRSGLLHADHRHEIWWDTAK